MQLADRHKSCCLRLIAFHILHVLDYCVERFFGRYMRCHSPTAVEKVILNSFLLFVVLLIFAAARLCLLSISYYFFFVATDFIVTHASLVDLGLLMIIVVSCALQFRRLTAAISVLRGRGLALILLFNCLYKQPEGGLDSFKVLQSLRVERFVRKIAIQLPSDSKFRLGTAQSFERHWSAGALLRALLFRNYC
ncbi:hypothetical protein Plhal304r1_c016g0058111 [Plasmopara halstedii]